MDEHKEYGARVEQGIVKQVRANGEEWEYKVESFSRPGVMTPWIKSILPIINVHHEAGEEKWKEQYLVGDRVFLFVFADGTGRVISRME